MSAHPACSFRSGSRLWLLALGLAPLACGAQSLAPQGTLSACAALSSDAERLACYDRLAGHAPPAAPAAPVAPAALPAPAAPAAPVAPAALPGPVAPAAPAAAATAPAAVPAVSTAGAAASAAPTPPKESFGLYAAEHPKPPPVSQTLEARVIALGHSASGRMTVSLEGGALWELDEADPLLAEGDVVSIARAAFGSYLMRTPSKRLLRAHRVH